MSKSAHLKDFAPPWIAFQTDASHPGIRKTIPMEQAENADGMLLSAGPFLSIQALPLGNDDRPNTELWSVIVLEHSQEISIGVLHIKPEQNAMRETFQEAYQALYGDMSGLRAATDRIGIYRNETEPVPEKPERIFGAQCSWYDPKFHVPVHSDLVYVAWTDADGNAHDGDRMAYYENGSWYWAFGDGDPIIDTATIDYWTPYLKRPET